MKMPDFDFVEPTTVSEAVDLLEADPEGSVVYAGGTDILVYTKAGAKLDRRLVSLGRVAGLDRLEVTHDGRLLIGAMTSVNRVARCADVERSFPGLADAARSLAAEQVRNQATVVGNICMAVPSADMAPILMARDAQLRVVSPDGERTISIRDFFVGPRRTVLGPADVVTEIEILPSEVPASGAAQRHGGRVSLSLPLAAAAAVIAIEDGVCRHAAISLGAVAPTPVLASAASDRLVGTELDDESLIAAGELAADESRPISDLRASREYRVELVKVLTRRVVRSAAQRVRGEG